MTAVMTSLIKSGAFDDIEEHRVEGQAKFRLLDFLTDKEIELVDHLSQYQDGDFDWVKIIRAISDEDKSGIVKEKYSVKIPNARRRPKIREALSEYDSRDLFDTKAQRIAWEQFYLGIALSGSEADIYRASHTCIDLVKDGYPEMPFEIAVCIDGVREIVTKKGDPMAFLTARDKTYVMDNIVVFPRTFSQSKRLLEDGNVIKIKGKVDDRGSLIADRVERIR
jgi:DNA polymerase III alpha subunit